VPGSRRGRYHVAAGPHLAQAGEALRRLLGQQAEQPGGQPDGGEAVLGHHSGQHRAVHVAGWPTDGEELRSPPEREELGWPHEGEELQLPPEGEELELPTVGESLA